MLDSTQVVSGIAILLSFLAGYRYGVRNFDEQTNTTETNTTENERVIVGKICIRKKKKLNKKLIRN